jgi:uncharacterized protein (TIGR03032 family)
VGEDRWATHDAEWRDPAQVVALWQGGEQASLGSRVRGRFWEALEGVCLLVTREYEHLAVALAAGQQTHMVLPHPSGIAVDAERERVTIASTRNPNQLVELTPAAAEGRPLVPVRTAFYPGSLYLHDLAYVGGTLHGNAVGQNAVVRLGADGFERVWWPRAIESDAGPDFSRNYLQLNSIAAGPSLEASFFSASTDRISARRPGHRNFPVDGRGVVFSGATREPVARGLTRPHSARLRKGRLWVESSGYGELGVIDDGRFEVVARLPGWTRGLAFHGDLALVGTSRVIPRFHMYAPGLDLDRSMCGVHAVDTRTGETVGSLVWPEGNQVFAVETVPISLTEGFPSGDVRDLYFKLPLA